MRKLERVLEFFTNPSIEDLECMVNVVTFVTLAICIFMIVGLVIFGINNLESTDPS